MTAAFGERLAAAFDTRGRLCVGIDPHPFLLTEWGLADDARGLREFGLRVVEASLGRVGMIKPQVAFFERHGSLGFAALEEIIAAARSAGILVIADAKRGDVGTSVDAYGQAWLREGSPLESDAMTISAYQGVGSILEPLRLAAAHGKGVFVLAATSNPEATSVQRATIGQGPQSGRSVAAGIVQEVIDWNSAHASAPIADVGVVLGATVRFADYGIDLRAIAAPSAAPILAPGFGHQGARFEMVGEIYGAAAQFSVVAASRSILGAGPDGLVAAIESHRKELS